VDESLSDETRAETDDPIDVVRGLIAAINRHDLVAIRESISACHRFTDSLGDVIEGADAVLQAWKAYFELFPDYQVGGEIWMRAGDRVAVFGRASGSLAHVARRPEKDAWSMPAAWLAQCEDGRVTGWRVYADNGIVRALMGDPDG
jgi:limonene-1,2-epoxide hydrolase